jgi:hypothetical protein
MYSLITRGIKDLRELIRSGDPVRLSFLTALLEDAGIESLILDTHSSIMQGSLGILPQRLMVADDDLAAAQKVLIEADQMADPKERKP